ncbi:MAG TPA: ATP-binding cassette domain-containing protein [Planctomycetota bacterium]|nr:ATP-binding cassette domain-containing protein [Planctomycetota bacterium]
MNAGLVLEGRDLVKTFLRETGETVRALDGVSLEVAKGALTALVGPDGAGKTTLLRLAAGLLDADSGTLSVLGLDAASASDEVQSRIAYMPQRFGLYEDLTVQENLDLYADLHGVSREERAERYPKLYEMTALGPFTKRLAGQLSGGMKQKLGLACTLVRSPELLLLDEPTVGVDPLSRRELWEIITRLEKEQGLTVLVSTSYLDEAERCAHAIVLVEGRALASGEPASVREEARGLTFHVEPALGEPARVLQARLMDDPSVIDAVPEAGRVRVVARERPPGAEPVEARFEDGFMVLLRRAKNVGKAAPHPDPPPAKRGEGETAVRVRDLVRRFGNFTAVDHVSFEVERGELYALLGPNGAGKTTVFRMLCGLLPPTEGELEVAGMDLREAPASARQRIGYVAQKFSLYGALSVTENLEFFASAYGLRGARKRERIRWALAQFELASLARVTSAQLPGGFKQRLSMAAALLHEPEILFLDEPTSGADPLARREFWRRITALASGGTTVIVTTHFMEEAEYCDRVAILDSGRLLAEGTPAEIRGDAPSMEDAFIAIVGHAPPPREAGGRLGGGAPHPNPPPAPRGEGVLRRVLALVAKEARQLARDPSSFAVGIVLPLILILLFGFGLSLDVKDVPIAIVLESPSPAAVDLAASFELSPYFKPRPMVSMREAERLLLERKIDGVLRIRSDFGRQVSIERAVVQVIVHGSDANQARIIQGYVQGAVGEWSARRIAEGKQAPVGPVAVDDRLWFNETNESRHFLVPGLIVIIMTLMGALLTTLVMAREWERGTLEALFVTPVRPVEILLGKTIPYFLLGMVGFALCLVAAKFLFEVPFRGSVLVLTFASMLYLLVALGIGLLVSSTFKNQLVASQITLLVTFLPAFMLSGFLFDLRSMPVAARAITYVLPARYYVALLQTAFLAGDVWGVILPDSAVLAFMALVLAFLNWRRARKKLA